MVEFTGSEPIYVQIARDLREQILTGSLPEGAQVMSTTAYATTYRINPATAAKAFSQLVDEGLLEKRRGVGMFVASGAQQQLRSGGRTEYRDDVLVPALRTGLALGMTPEELIGQISSALNELQEEAR